MIGENKFEELISKNECSTLDFKKGFYDFQNDNDKNTTAKFVKDVISFSNTIRTETSYIIFGLKESENGELQFFGIDKTIDEATLQQKVKNKVIPSPIFSFSTLNYKGLKYGILEFPIHKYEMPIVPTVNKLRGLEVGKVYYRNGSSNTEAGAYDVIRINDWLKSLPEIKNSNSLNDKVSYYLRELTKSDQKLSVLISELYSLASEFDLKELKEFCSNEIQGIESQEVQFSTYRVQKVFFSWNKININPYSWVKPNVDVVRREMEQNDEFFEKKLMLHHPIIEIENSLERLLVDPNSYGTMESDTKSLLGMEKNYPIFIYTFPDNWKALYSNIRQKAIDLLMKV